MNPLRLGSTLALLASPPAAADVVTPLEHVMYDYGVAEYCGLVDQMVWDGFRRESLAIIAADRMSREMVKQSSFNAALAVAAPMPLPAPVMNQTLRMLNSCFRC